MIGTYKTIIGVDVPIYGYRLKWLPMVKRFKHQVKIDFIKDKIWINVRPEDFKLEGENDRS